MYGSYGEAISKLEKYFSRCDRLRTGTLSQLQVERVMRKLHPELLVALSAEDLLGQLFKHSQRSRSGQNHVHYRPFLREVRSMLSTKDVPVAEQVTSKPVPVGVSKSAPYATYGADLGKENGYAWDNINGGESFSPERPQTARPPSRTLKARCSFPAEIGVADPILHSWKVMPTSSKYMDREQEVMPAGNVSYFHSAHIKPRLKKGTDFARRLGEYNPVTHAWVCEPTDESYQTRTDGEPAEQMRGGTGSFVKRVGVYDPVKHVWTASPSDSAYTDRAGMTPSEIAENRVSESTRVGVYNPIAHSWLSPPTDARYVNRAGPSAMGGEEAVKLLHYGTGRKRVPPPTVLDDCVTLGTFLGPGKRKVPPPERCGIYNPVANSWTKEPQNKDYVNPPEPRMKRPASAPPPTKTKLDRKLVTSEGKQFTSFKDRIGTYDPIKHVWVSPPQDPEFLDYWTGELVARPDYQQNGLRRRRRKRRLPASAFNPVVGKLVAWQS